MFTILHSPTLQNNCIPSTETVFIGENYNAVEV
jgi:hypothetical protein